MQLELAATVPPFVQVVPAAIANWLALTPPSATVVKCNVSVPPLVNVSTCVALVAFSRWFPNATGLGVGVACGNTPVPVRFATCEAGLASSVKVTVAVCAPNAVGVKVRFTMQVNPAATVDPFVQVVPAAIANWLALAPPSATVVKCSVSVPPLVNVSTCVALVVFSRWFPKATGLGVGVACGNVPVPVSGNVCGLPVALSATDTVALRAPNALGVNVAAIVQFPPAATVPMVRQSVPLAGVASA